jgi:hypothetical protein
MLDRRVLSETGGFFDNFNKNGRKSDAQTAISALNLYRASLLSNVLPPPLFFSFSPKLMFFDDIL